MFWNWRKYLIKPVNFYTDNKNVSTDINVNKTNCRPGCGPGSPMAAEDNPGRGATGGTESLPYDQGHVAGVIS